MGKFWPTVTPTTPVTHTFSAALEERRATPSDMDTSPGFASRSKRDDISTAPGTSRDDLQAEVMPAGAAAPADRPTRPAAQHKRAPPASLRAEDAEMTDNGLRGPPEGHAGAGPGPGSSASASRSGSSGGADSSSSEAAQQGAGSGEVVNQPGGPGPGEEDEDEDGDFLDVAEILVGVKRAARVAAQRPRSARAPRSTAGKHSNGRHGGQSKSSKYLG